MIAAPVLGECTQDLDRGLVDTACADDASACGHGVALRHVGAAVDRRDEALGAALLVGVTGGTAAATPPGRSPADGDALATLAVPLESDRERMAALVDPADSTEPTRSRATDVGDDEAGATTAGT